MSGPGKRTPIPGPKQGMVFFKVPPYHAFHKYLSNINYVAGRLHEDGIRLGLNKSQSDPDS